MIRPTVGRVVLFHPSGADAELHPIVGGQPHAAIIAHVHSDTHINVSAFDAAGVQYGVTYVLLLQDGQHPPSGGPYAQWMPFQVGQAAAADSKGGIMERVAAIETRLNAPKTN